jgi:hemerythrin superfamily protein
MGISDYLKELAASIMPESGKVTDILKADHRKVETLFAKFEESTKNMEKRKVLDSIIEELTVHAKVEEQLVYPVLDKTDHEGAGEALQEHHVVKFLLRELKNAEISDETKAKVTVLKEMVQHHVKEEEQQLFPELESSKADLISLGNQVKEKKEQLKARSKATKSSKLIATNSNKGSARAGRSASKRRKAS